MVKKYYCDFRRTLFVAVMALAFVGALSFFGTVYAVSGSYTDAHSNVVQWDLDTDTGVMDIKVKGTASDDGAIIDFDRTEAPWYPYEKSVKEVNIGTGIKWLGGSTFLKYEYLEKATIKGPEAEISDLFFGECWWLQDVVIPSNDDVYIVTTSEMDEDGNWQDDPMYDGYDEVLGPFSGCDFYVLARFFVLRFIYI